MHYGKTSFSINGQPTIRAIDDPNKQLGQRNGFSKTDIAQLNALYDCSGDVQLFFITMKPVFFNFNKRYIILSYSSYYTLKKKLYSALPDLNGHLPIVLVKLLFYASSSASYLSKQCLNYSFLMLNFPPGNGLILSCTAIFFTSCRVSSVHIFISI